MKLSISNIAWPSEEEEKFLKYIRKWGCSGVEIAPSRLWPEPLEATKKDRLSFKSLVRKYDLDISALQALLYGQRGLGLFRSPEIEEKTIEYLKGLCQLAADLDARVLVFGSPANRKRGSIPLQTAYERAATFFSKVASAAKDLGVCICIEPLRPQETDFITTAMEGLKLVSMVNNEGFGLHLDAKAVAEEGGNFSDIFRTVIFKLKHFHINDPGLTEVNSTKKVDHKSMGLALKNAGYKSYVSIEMRKLPDYFNVIKRSLLEAKEAYLN
ncbi:MAG: sugar phosphate isomerase/epimerase [Deltaproteobacteria bacterium]|nr:sugar phosphate isomerase/epimerase [Deltaproteobacteria bacterium]